MSPPEWHEIESLLDLALDLDPDKWPEFLDARCPNRPELRAEVWSLLQASETPDTLLDNIPRISGRDLLDELNADIDSDGFQTGDRIDRYTVVKLLGRGGQGAVYLAERSDGVFDKRVAIKVVKRGMVTEEVLARFRGERQILADLEHPNIASILDGGVTEDGLPYLVMEFVEGETIDRYCDRKRLSLEDRLRLFTTVCEAVHYAHRNLVVHRDLKPGNILVTARGDVRLLDFGIARVMEPHGAGFRAPKTQAVIPRLTPEYAAPEQVLGIAMTTATDVYALGVILYELLSGLSPYEIAGRSLLAIQRVVCELDPKPPSRAVDEYHQDPEVEDGASLSRLRSTSPAGLCDDLRGDLDAIAMKAMEKDPDDRYQGAQDLMGDIRRHLNGHPVEARPHTRWYRATKFARRNRLTVSLAGGAAAALLAGLITTTWQWTEAQRQSGLRQAAADQAHSAREFVVGVFEGIHPDELQGQPITSQILIDKGLDDIRHLDDNPALQHGSLNAIGRVALNLGETTRADSIFDAALALPWQRSPSGALDRAETLVGYGESLRDSGEGERSVALLREALSLQESALDPKDPVLASTMLDLGFSLYTVGTPESRAEAEGLLVRASSFGIEGLEEARRLQYLGDVYLAREEMSRAIDFYTRAANEAERSEGPDHPEVGRSLMGLAATLRQAGDYAGAEQTYRRVRAVFEQSYTAEHPFVSRAVLGLARSQFFMGRYEEAVASAYEVPWPRAARVTDLKIYVAARLVAVRAHMALGDHQRAAQVAAIVVREIEATDAHSLAATPRLLLGTALLSAGQPGEALSVMNGLSADQWSLLEVQRQAEDGREVLARAAAGATALE